MATRMYTQAAQYRDRIGFSSLVEALLAVETGLSFYVAIRVI